MSFTSDPGLQANQLPISVDVPKDWDKFQEFIELWIKRNTNAVNTKEGGLYSLSEIFSFKQYFTINNPNVFRNVYRKTFDMVSLNGGNIAIGATVSSAHNITGLKYQTMAYAGCTQLDGSGNLLLGFSVMGNNDVWLDPMNVNFKNNSGVILGSVLAVAEYLKN